VKFYTEDGNRDLVGNNLAVFFIRDAIKFPDVVHALEPDPVTFRQEPSRTFDFMSQTPESMHMLINLFSPRGLPSDYRHMQGFGVNTYTWINEQGESVLVKYHWIPTPGVRSMTDADAANIQAYELGHATKDLCESIENGDHPEWELRVQMVADGEHPELDFDPLDDTKTWPENDFPALPVGRMVLDRNPVDQFPENEQISFGTGVTVDGLDFSDDQMLIGRTFSYTDTQRYRVGPNRLREGRHPQHDEQGPVIEGRLRRKRIPPTQDYEQSGQRYLLMEDRERDDLLANVVTQLGQCERDVDERMVWHFLLVEDELGQRVGEVLGIKPADVGHLEPLQSQTLPDEDQQRLANLGNNGRRDVEGLTMTHCVPDEHYVTSR
jgi:catalase